MRTAQLIDNLQSPKQLVDVILDTDAYNEIDDQYAIAYMIHSSDRIAIKGICAAPFYNDLSDSPEDGMIRSYHEIIKLLKLANREDLCNRVYKGSVNYLDSEDSPQISNAASFMADIANSYSPEHPLYIVSIGAITNVASALLMNPAMKDNTVVVWLGGHAHQLPKTDEFNMRQDIAAARVVFDSGVPLVQIPCCGVVDRFTISKQELEFWLLGKNKLADYLARNTIQAAEKYASGWPWTRVIWDVTAVAWLLNDGNRFMLDELRPAPIPEYDGRYAFDNTRHFIKYVTHINRDILFHDLFQKLV